MPAIGGPRELGLSRNRGEPVGTSRTGGARRSSRSAAAAWLAPRSGGECAAASARRSGVSHSVRENQRGDGELDVGRGVGVVLRAGGDRVGVDVTGQQNRV